ncbi:MAG: hypothetical protein ABSD56_14475 [Bryobacteraceae bacterium]
MRGHRGLFGTALAVTVFVSGCGGAAATPTAGAGATPTPGGSATAAATATPTATTAASPSSAVSGFYLRSWSIAPIGPEDTFGSVPLVISNGQLLTAKYPPAADPYPIYAQPVRRTISGAGLTKILAEVQNDGLLGTVTSFECPHGEDDPMMAGTATQHLVLIVGGASHEVTASCPYQQPSPAPGIPAPATWAAFQHFVSLLSDPASWLGAEIGPASPYDPDKLAVLAVPMETGPDASAETPNPVDVMAWPLTAPFTMFGVGSLGGRCAVVEGADAAALLPVVKVAYGTTVFRDRTGAFASVIVRAFMPGEPDPCGS